MTDGERMTEIVKLRKSTTTLYVCDGSPSQIVLIANPRRTYLRFMPPSGGTYPQPIPGPVPDNFLSWSARVSDLHIKLDDCPATLCGEWYVTGPLLGAQIVIVEEEYVGR